MPTADQPVVEPFLARPRDARLLADLAAVFFAASATKTFASDQVREQFYARWLGQFLSHDPQHAFVAIVRPGTADEKLVGYLVGSIEDPAQSQRFDDLGYFRTLARLTARYPAQLHVNLAPEWRGLGVGRTLVEEFCRHAEQAGVPGVHVFTGRGMRNVGFYRSNGFTEAAAVEWNGREIVMLVRDLR